MKKPSQLRYQSSKARDIDMSGDTSVEGRLPRPCDEENRQMSLKDEAQDKQK